MLRLLLQLDEWLFHLINETFANPVGDFVFPWLNHGAPFLLLLVVALGWLVYRNLPRHWLALVVVIGGMALGDALIVNPLKHVVRRPRPAATLPSVRILASGATGGHAFPSSHAANAFLAATLLSVFFRRPAAGWFAGAALIGLSRIYVGAHYPSDVLGGALLGCLSGWGMAALLRKIRPAWISGPTPLQACPPISARGPSADDPCASRSIRSWPAWTVLAVLQAIRLAWAAGTSLDVPPGSARLWWLATAPGPSAHPLLRGLGQAWFGVFGSSPFSMWALPWVFQSLWIGALALACWRTAGPQGRAARAGDPLRIRHLWSLVLLTAILPLVAQLSFFGSPAQILEDAGWEASLPAQALVLYLILGLPIWVVALTHFRSHAYACGLALIGLILGASVPSLPWLAPALAVSGVVVRLAEWMAHTWSAWHDEARGPSRLLLTMLVLYGLAISAAVYSPRVLRKINLSILPRNNPQYAQTGWREWSARIRPRIESRPATRQIWVASPVSRDQLQYWLGSPYRVLPLTDLRGPDLAVKLERSLGSSGAFLVREVYLNQINPRVIFLGRCDDWIPSAIRSRMRELDSVEIFRKGDPVRQFQLYFLPPPGTATAGQDSSR